MPAKDGSPTKLSVVMYQVGFGDCFLLSFTYPGESRHVLIDFGSTGLPTDAPSDELMRIAADVKARTGGKLHAVVETHRHADHISGFATKNGKGPGDVIASLNPDLVVQPWTEDPKAAPDAKQATATASEIKGFVASLDAMHNVAAAAVAEARMLSRGSAAVTAGQLAFLGEKNLKNLSAVQNLQAMSKRHRYLNYGADSGLETVLPGVAVHVLGPPTLVQSNAITKETSSDPTEFWQLQALTGARFSAGRRALFPRAVAVEGARGSSSVQWFRQRVQNIRSEGLFELVRSLDKQMNNTSVILLFEISGKLFLFPGDAQLENWQYALSQPETKKLLPGVDFYKVGHHGSRNATPKTMWALLKNKSTVRSSSRLTTVVSTMAGKFGSVAKATEVPRNTLVAELRKESDYSTTQDIKRPALSRVLDFTI